MKKVLNLIFLSVFFTEIGFYLSNTTLLSLSNNSSALFLIILFIINFNKVKKIEFLSLIIIFISLLLNFFIKESFLLESRLAELMYLTILVLALIVVRKLKLTIKDFSLLKLLIYFLTILHLFGSFQPENYGFYPYNQLMYGYSNPNVLSSVILTNVIFLVVLRSKKIIFRLLDISLVLVNIYLISLTGSRTALISGLAMLILFLFRNKIPKIIIYFSGYLSVIFPFVFIPIKGIAKGALAIIAPFFQTHKVDSLNGRDYIWSEQFRLLSTDFNYFLFGAQPPDSSLTFRNSHNYLLSIFYNHGIIILLMYIYTLFKSVQAKLNFNHSTYNSMSVVAWFVVIVSNTFESYLTSGIISVSILWIILLSDIQETDQ